jgi:hypothetical protein
VQVVSHFFQSRLGVGAHVRLVQNFQTCSDAARGPLAPGDIGRIVADDGSGKPFRVVAPNGNSWWYTAEALVSAVQPEQRSGVVRSGNIITGARVVRGPDWRWADQDGNGQGVIIRADSEGWVSVKWDHNGMTNTYRVGGQSKFDLMYVAEEVGVIHPLHAHRLGPCERRSYHCDVCRSAGEGRHRCLAGCDWDACGSCLTRSGHRGEWRGPERSQWCSTAESINGMQCSHGIAILTRHHWSCCGSVVQNGPGCFATVSVF